MAGSPSVAEWWKSVESGSLDDEHGPEWLARLQRAHDHLVAFRVAEGIRELEGLEGVDLDPEWDAVARLLQQRAVVRRAIAAEIQTAIDETRQIAASAGEKATRGRAWHLVGVALLRLDRIDDAEAALVRAMADVEQTPARWWVADSFAQCLLGSGAFEEARRTLERLVELRAEIGDDLGVAISAGHLAGLLIDLGRPASASALIESVLASHGAALVPLSRLRLTTYLLGAAIDAEQLALARRVEPALRRLLTELDGETHYLIGHAAIALARFAQRLGQADDVGRWIELADSIFTLPDHRSLSLYWRARLDRALLADEDWNREIEAAFANSQRTSEVEVRTRLLLAQVAADNGDIETARSRLAEAHETSQASNNRIWIRWVEELAERIAPPMATALQIRRFSGRSLEELSRTIEEEVTIVFADLVGFSTLAERLEPDEVMSTVRCFFELAASLQATYKIRPLSYLGDGLLAVAQGDDHKDRGLRFALDLVRRTARVALLRNALGESWGPELRAGVATGIVVLGTLGTQLKREFSAIGRTTNRAARLQGEAMPGEVVCDRDTASDEQWPVEMLSLKGVGEVSACRIAGSALD